MGMGMAILRRLALLILVSRCCFAAPPKPAAALIRPSESFQPILPITPPHCTKTSVIKSTLSHAAGDESLRTILMNIHIGLGSTVCFRIDNGSSESDEASAKPSAQASSIFADVLSNKAPEQGWLHTLTLTQLEHHHPITQHYEFAIPEVSTSCICDCDPTSNDTSCYRTFHASQSDAGCAPGSQSKLCCEVSFRPYKNRSYMAVKLEQPSTFVVFKYVAYDYTAGRWVEKDKNTIRVEIDGRTQTRYLDGWHRIELSVSAGGRASRQLESGMYFTISNRGGEMDQLRKQPINELNENNFERLGWYRKDASGHFGVRNGKVKIQKIHLAKVDNCKEQRSQSYLDAHHYVDMNDPENPERFSLEDSVEHIYPWIRSAQVVDGSARQAIVVHSEGTNLEVILQVHDRSAALSFLHDFSKLDDFTGTIIVDFKSNRYFNLTVYNATGIIHGIVKRTVDRGSPEDFSFTTYIDDLRSANKTVIVPLPAMVGGGDRLICLRADDERPQTEVCRIVPFREEPLEINLLENTWKELEGHCAECNKITVNGFLTNLNPLNWVSGVSSLSNFIMMVSDMLVYLFMCGLCPSHTLLNCCSAKSKGSNSHKHCRHSKEVQYA
ncbi:unnamed protein product [Anisakis simplex]|uniref:Receptor protein-tyrosine kinase n=1 Tax=Anisakis simplex TaxID=6269 RepID=A0A0M3K1V8_ANISI|nr:unnamed protein product [Anisakis simplex]